MREIGSRDLHENAFQQAESRQYVETSKSADFFRNVSQYLFWGATFLLPIALGLAFAPQLMGAVVADGATAATLNVLGSQIPAATAAIWAGSASLVTMAGSLLASRTATHMTEKNNILYSDIDSQHQAYRMVQSFEKERNAGKNVGTFEPESLPAGRADGKSWVQYEQERRAAAPTREMGGV